MRNIQLLKRRVEPMYKRLSELYHDVSICASPSPDVLSNALRELGIISEVLQVAMNELAAQSEQLAATQSQLEAERQRYQELFEFAIDGYLVTDAEGIIQEANRAATDLLNMQAQFLIGKPLLNLISTEDRSNLQAKLSQVSQLDHLELVVKCQRYCGDLFEAALTGEIIRVEGKIVGLRWLMRDVTERKRAETVLVTAGYNPCHDRALYSYRKGEVIPLEPQSIWLVSKGIIKLTTLSESGTEMLVGFAKEETVFGSSLTLLQVYQAIALTEVQIASIPLTEIAQSPHLVQALLPMISQRLRQAESFLAIYGQIRVEDRFNYLLLLLKQTVGQPTENGVRLRVRLTHQDFASLCCTTRVTITRLLSKLQQEGKIILDSKNHLILKEETG